MTLFSRALQGDLVPRRATAASSTLAEMLGSEGAIRLTDDTYASYVYLYASQPWVQVAVNKLARGIGRIPIKAYDTAADGTRTLAHDSALARLMRRPATGVSRFAWTSAIVGNIAVYGSCIGVKVQSGPGVLPDEIVPFSPVGWKYDEAHDEYLYRAHSGDPIRFPGWRIWHPSFWAPGPYSTGLPPMEALRRTLAIEDGAQRLGIASFRNGARPSGLLVAKQRMKEDAIRRLRANIRRVHGGPDRAFNLAIVEGDYEWVAMSHNMAEAAVLEHRKLSREEVAAVFDLPQPAIGILDNANFASINALHLMLYQDTYGVWVEMLEESFRADVIEPVDALRERATVKFDMRALLRGDLATRTQAYQRLITTGVNTQNEIRELEDYPRVNDPSADQLLRPMSLAPDPAAATGAQNAPGENTSEKGI